ncbi:MAG: AzlC family ABC transporter permease [Hyphomicrobiaceae bacterium]|nr:AzlC family ABC transporter permease [Hyphomicrobiaceae bacterium]
MIIDDDSLPPQPAPEEAWWRGASRAAVFRRGMMVAFSVPGLILLASAGGFGALANDAGFSLANAVFMMGVFFALPGQVVMLDQMARGGSLAGGALAVALTGIRLLPMSVALMPYLKGPRATRLGYIIAAHFIAVTAWMEGWRRLPRIPAEHRIDHFIGIGTGLVAATLFGTTAGFLAAGAVPSFIAAVLLFLTPVYFLVSLIATSSGLSDRLAIVAGAMLGPPLYIMVPGLDLLLTGLIGGTIAHFGARAWDKS